MPSAYHEALAADLVRGGRFAGPMAADSSSSSQQAAAAASAHEQQKKRMANPILTKVVPAAVPVPKNAGVATTTAAAAATAGSSKEMEVESVAEKTRGPPKGPAAK